MTEQQLNGLLDALEQVNASADNEYISHVHFWEAPDGDVFYTLEFSRFFSTNPGANRPVMSDLDKKRHIASQWMEFVVALERQGRGKPAESTKTRVPIPGDLAS